MKYSLYFLILTLPLICLLSSCRSNGTDESVTLTNTTSYQNNLAEDLARSLAQAGQDPAIRRFLKNAMLARFDGDYNALVVALWHQPLKEGEALTFGDALWQRAPVPGYGGSKGFYKAIAQQHPLLQIALPQQPGLNPADWPVETLALPVAVAPLMKNTGKAKGFTPQGVTLWYTTMQAPGHLVLVVSVNERVVYNPKKGGMGDRQGVDLSLNEDIPYFSTHYGHYYRRGWGPEKKHGQALDILPPDDGGPTGDDTGGNPDIDRGNCGLACDRDCYTEKEVIVRFRYATSYLYSRNSDPWLDGNLEILCRVIFFKANNIGELDFNYDIREADVKHLQWYYLNTKVLTWDEQVHGPSLAYVWFELDGGSVTTFDSGGITTTIRDKDDQLGFALVEYCDNTDGPHGQQYLDELTQPITFNVR